MDEETIAGALAGKKGMTSVEAAALILSGGATKDAEEAQILASADAFDMDGLQRSHLRRMMGFDFRIKIRPDQHKILVSSKDGPKVRTHAKIKDGEIDQYGNIINEDLIDRLVDACARLKAKWEAANDKADA